MKTFLLAFTILLGLHSDAQITKASLPASGLTCSMCSTAVLNGLKEIPSVEEVRAVLGGGQVLGPRRLPLVQPLGEAQPVSQ